jgi:hypothetical protein
MASLQSFGTYDTTEAAATAYDIGYILFRGPSGKINRPIDTYINQSNGRFHQDVEIPEQVSDAVKRYLESPKFPHADKTKVLERIMSYFEADQCPFL